MADKTKIAWSDATWQPVVGCTKVSTGCKNCFAERMAARLAGKEYANSTDTDTGLGPLYLQGNKYLSVTEVCHVSETKNKRLWNGKTYCDESALNKPLHWKKPRMIFVCSMGDLFHESVPFDFIDKVMAVIALCPQHTFQVLTKRPERMAEYFSSIGRKAPLPDRETAIELEVCCLDKKWQKTDLVLPLPNLWLGVTAENQEQADKRIPILLQIPAAVRFVSVEPMLGPVDMRHIQQKHWARTQYIDALTGKTSPSLCLKPYKGIDWVIIGCESGPGARECKTKWVRDLVGQCKAADVPPFVKQLQMYKTPACERNDCYGVCEDNPHRKYKRFKTENIEQFPSDLQIRQYPNK